MAAHIWYSRLENLFSNFENPRTDDCNSDQGILSCLHALEAPPKSLKSISLDISIQAALQSNDGPMYCDLQPWSYSDPRS